LISRLHPSFRRAFGRLPRDVQERAREAYRRFQANPLHPGLQFKRLYTAKGLYSIRISDSYRAVGALKNDTEIVWFFIGSHAEYDKLLESL